MRNQLFIGVAAVALIAPAAAIAQETTSTIQGTVTSDGAPVAGAAVTITHVPSGTVSRVTTTADGTFSAAGLRVGGPFTVTVDQTNTQVTDIYTIAGQPYNVPIDTSPQTADVVVTAARVKGAGVIGSGPSTVLNANDISKVASVNRDIRDLMRRDPFATLDTSQSTGRQVTFAGVNPRFNRFTVDGVPITDSFGLNADALPSRRGPVPLDSIAEFQTKVAPYDIREGFFEGGVINAILRSGTNSFQGTGFYSVNSDQLTGTHLKPYAPAGGTAANGLVPVLPFKSEDYGAELSGPIIKDKLFFMISGERVRNNTPFNANANPLLTTADGQAALAQILNIASTKYGVTAGGQLTNQNDKDDRLVGRLDWNVTDGQRLALTGIYTKDSINTLGVNTSLTGLSTESNDYVKPDRVVAGVATLNSTWSPTVSTETRVMYKDYQSGQTPLGAPTALAVICSDATNLDNATSCSTGKSTVDIGPLGSAATNVLHVQTFDAQELVRVTLNNHNVRLLYDFQNVKNYDLFISATTAAGSAGAYGAYYFDSIAAFEAGQAQAFGYANATTGNPNDAAALFSYQTHTFGIQDNWQVTPTVTVNYGLRYDLYGGHDRPDFNPAFLAREGFANTSYLSGRGLLQPRVGFDWKATSRLGVHGGIGIFGGGTPDVYIGNSFSASGVQPSNISLTNATPGSSAVLNNVSLTSVPAAAQALLKASPVTAATAALAPNFKIPSQWRGSLSADYDLNLGPLGNHWILSGNALISKTREAIFYHDGRDIPLLNSDGTPALTPDGRQRYQDITPLLGQGNSSTATDMILGNTTKGHGYVGTVSLAKKFGMGIDLYGSFTYEDVWDQQALTSSVATSLYSNGAFYDANGGAFGHSNDEVRYSAHYEVGYEHAFFRDYKTKIQLFGETRIGSPYSYVMTEASTLASGRGSVFGTALNTGRFLFYVPNGPDDPKVTYDSAATKAQIMHIIQTTGLKNFLGQIAPRNAFNSKWFTKIDLHLEQEIPTFIGHSRISVFADIENLPNLINHKWGEQLRNFFPFTDSVAKVSCVAQGANGCAQYKYSAPSSDTFLADQLVTVNGSSLYSIRVGARFSF
jgi:hypothetical protein